MRVVEKAKGWKREPMKVWTDESVNVSKCEQFNLWS